MPVFSNSNFYQTVCRTLTLCQTSWFPQAFSLCFRRSRRPFCGRSLTRMCAGLSRSSPRLETLQVSCGKVRHSSAGESGTSSPRRSPVSEKGGFVEAKQKPEGGKEERESEPRGNRRVFVRRSGGTRLFVVFSSSLKQLVRL